jgi:hypothetical protein
MNNLINKQLPERTFLERALNNEIVDLYEELNNEIDNWHFSTSNVPIYKWLGLTFSEYTAFVEDSSYLDTILELRKSLRT